MALSFSTLFEIKTGNTVTELKNVKTSVNDAKEAVNKFTTAWNEAGTKVTNATTKIVAAFKVINDASSTIVASVNAIGTSFDNLKQHLAPLVQDLAPLANVVGRLAGNMKYLADQDAKATTSLTNLGTNSKNAEAKVAALESQIRKLSDALKDAAKYKLPNLNLNQRINKKLATALATPSVGNQLTGGPGLQSNPYGRNAGVGGDVLGLVSVLMGGALVGQLKGLSDGIVEAKLRSDEFRTSLDALGLSAEKTGELYNQLKEYTKYGFDLPELEKATKEFEMLNLPIAESLKLATELSAVASKPLASAVNVLEKIGNQSQLSGRMLQNQFNISPALLDAEAKREGGPSVVKDNRVQLGGPEDVAILLKYVQAITDARGGQQKLQEQADNLKGSFAVLATKIEEAKVALGDHLGPIVIGLNKTLDGLIDKFQNLSDGEKGAVGSSVFLAGTFAGLMAALAPAIYTLVALGNAFRSLSVAMELAGIGAGTLLIEIGLVAGLVGILAVALLKAGGAVADLINELSKGEGLWHNLQDALKFLFGGRTDVDNSLDNAVKQWTNSTDAYTASLTRAIAKRAELGAGKASIADIMAGDPKLTANQARAAAQNFLNKGAAQKNAFVNSEDRADLNAAASSYDNSIQAFNLVRAKGPVSQAETRMMISALKEFTDFLKTTKSVTPELKKIKDERLSRYGNEISKLEQSIVPEVRSKKAITDPAAQRKKLMEVMQQEEAKLWKTTTAEVNSTLAKFQQQRAAGVIGFDEERRALDHLLNLIGTRNNLEKERLATQKAYMNLIKEEYKVKVKEVEDTLKLKEALKTATPQDKVQAAEEKVRLAQLFAQGERKITGRVSPETKDRIHEAEIAAKGAAKAAEDIAKENKTKLIDITKGEYAAKLSEVWKYQQELEQRGLKGVELEKLLAAKREEIEIDHQKKITALQRAAQDDRDNAETARLKLAETKLAFQREQGHGIDSEGGISIDEKYKDARHAVVADEITTIIRDRDRKLNDLSREIADPRNADPLIKAGLQAEKEALLEFAKAKIEALKETLEETDVKEAELLKKRKDEAKLEALRVVAQGASFKAGEDAKKAKETTDPAGRIAAGDQAQDSILAEFTAQMAVLKAQRDIALKDENKNKLEQANIEKKYAEDVLELRQKMVDASKALTAEILKQKGLEDKSKGPEMGGVYKSYADISKAVDAQPGEDGRSALDLFRSKGDVEEKAAKTQAAIQAGSAITTKQDQIAAAQKRREELEARTKDGYRDPTTGVWVNRNMYSLKGDQYAGGYGAVKSAEQNEKEKGGWSASAKRKDHLQQEPQKIIIEVMIDSNGKKVTQTKTVDLKNSISNQAPPPVAVSSNG